MSILQKPKQALLTTLAATSLLLGQSAIDPKPANAWASHEHLTGYAHNKTNQAEANAACRSIIYNRIDWHGGMFYDYSHGGWITFMRFARPYVWGHVSLNRCVINASWGYTRN